MATPAKNIPRINFVALIAAALLLVSAFLDWWGIGVSNGVSFDWSLWSGPNTIFLESTQSTQPLVTYSPIIGAVVIGAAVLAVLGTIPRISPLLIGSSALAVIAPVVYVIIVNDAVSTACNGMSTCITGPVGSQNFGFGVSLNWGFQTGFYLEIVGAILSVIAIAFQRTFLGRTTS